jgi:hypothetical protein
LKNPDSPDFPECPDLFPESSGFILQTLNHKVVHLFHDSSLTSISFFFIQMVRVKVQRETEEPSTQRRTKARHDPAALRAVQEELG